MSNTIDNDDSFHIPRDRAYPDADNPKAGFYGTGASEPLHWVDADGVPDPREGTLSPFPFYYSPPVRQKRHHSLLPWLIAALIILLALPFFKVVLAVLAVISFIVVAVLGLGLLTLIVSALILAHRMRILSRRMYL